MSERSTHPLGLAGGLTKAFINSPLRRCSFSLRWPRGWWRLCRCLVRRSRRSRFRWSISM